MGSQGDRMEDGQCLGPALALETVAVLGNHQVSWCHQGS